MQFPETPVTFTSTSKAATTTTLLLFGGILFAAIAVIGFGLALVARSAGLLQLHLSSTLPAILSVGMFTAAYQFAKAPWQVVVSQVGLELYSSKGVKTLGWEQITMSKVESQPYTGKRMLALYGINGRMIARLSSGLDNFDGLSQLIEQRLRLFPPLTADAAKWKKAKRNAVVALIAAVVVFAGVIGLSWMTYTTHRDNQLLQDTGVDAEGNIVRLFVAPDGRTHRVEFRVANAGDDAYLHNVEIRAEVWQLLQGAARVPIRTVPGHPDIARLTFGQVDDSVSNPSPALNVFLAIALLALGIFFLVASILAFKGIDISIDPVTKKWKVERLTRTKEMDSMS